MASSDHDLPPSKDARKNPRNPLLYAGILVAVLAVLTAVFFYSSSKPDEGNGPGAVGSGAASGAPSGSAAPADSAAAPAPSGSAAPAPADAGPTDAGAADAGDAGRTDAG